MLTSLTTMIRIVKELEGEIRVGLDIDSLFTDIGSGNRGLPEGGVGDAVVPTSILADPAVAGSGDQSPDFGVAIIL